MILDANLELSSAQSVKKTGPTTNVIDQLDAGDSSNPLFLCVRVAGIGKADGAATLQFQLQTDTNAEFRAPVSVYTSQAFSIDSITANSELIKTRLPSGLKRYVRGNFVVEGKFDGTFDVFFAETVQNN